jgi:hypothetical protein
MRNALYSLLFLMLAFAGCKPAQKTTSTQQGGRYHEDLSAVRPKIEETPVSETNGEPVVKRDPKAYVEARFTVNKQLDAVLDSIDRINLKRKFIDGYVIQVYSGLNREEALNVKKDLSIYLPKLEADVYYNQPNFRVKAGKYFNPLEAQKDFQQIKAYFPNAIIVPDKIAIN